MYTVVTMITWQGIIDLVDYIKGSLAGYTGAENGQESD